MHLRSNIAVEPEKFFLSNREKVIELGVDLKLKKNLSTIKTICYLYLEQKCAQFLYINGFVSKNKEA